MNRPRWMNGTSIANNTLHVYHHFQKITSTNGATTPSRTRIPQHSKHRTLDTPFRTPLETSWSCTKPSASYCALHPDGHKGERDDAKVSRGEYEQESGNVLVWRTDLGWPQGINRYKREDISPFSLVSSSLFLSCLAINKWHTTFPPSTVFPKPVILILVKTSPFFPCSALFPRREKEQAKRR